MERYDRQIKFNGFGENGQENLMSSTLMVMGAGALGTHVSEMLVRMGVGKLIIIDMDIVEITNLHRQALYTEKDAEHLTLKVDACKEKLCQINGNVEIVTINTELNSSNISTILKKYQPDIVIDSMDNFEIRFLINEACHKYDIPWVYGAALGSKGSVYGIDYKGPCLKCLMETLPLTGESCAINGVLPPVVSLIASIEVSEVIRYLSGRGFSKQLITVDTFKIGFQTINIDELENKDCEVCKKQVYEHLNKNLLTTVQSNCGSVYTLRFDESVFNQKLPGKTIRSSAFVKLMTYKKYKLTLFKDGRMNVYGISRKEEANALYHEITEKISEYTV